jgi:hypothetical protein
LLPLAAGCGGGTPLLHPAHALSVQEVTMGAGVSNNFVLGDGKDKIEAARNATAQQGAISQPKDEQDYVEGAVAHVLTAPGLAPWVGARAGIGFDSDAGVAFTGRSLRLDGRHAFQDDELALSVGLGASGLLLRNENEAASGSKSIPGLDASGVTGWGLDVPFLVGWRSTASLIQIYGGLRGSYERAFGTVNLSIYASPDDIREADLDASHWTAGALAGLSVGVSPVFVIVELGAGYTWVKGSLDIPNSPGPAPTGTTHHTADLSAFTLAPAGALLTRF